MPANRSTRQWSAVALSGSASKAAALLAEHDFSASPSLMWTVDLLQAGAWTAAARGDLSEARHLLDQAATVGESDGYLVGAAAAVHGMARLGHAKQVMHRLEALAGQIEGELAPARLAHTQSLAHRDPNGLDNASVAFKAMGADLLAAEAAADAAVAWRQAGDPRRGAAHERRAATLAERCEGATTPALRAVEARARLTPANPGRAGSGPSRRRRALQQRNRRPAESLGPQRRKPAPTRLRETRRPRPSPPERIPLEERPTPPRHLILASRDS
jgi:hypothetical protein